MTGIITPNRAEKHVRVRLELDSHERVELFFLDPRRFGRFLVVPARDYRSLPTLRAMGPEPLSEAFTPEGFHAELERSSIPLKTYLLSQKPVSGVGNIYADEALWACGLHPCLPARQVTLAQAAELRQAIRAVLAASIEAQGTTLNDYRTVNGELGAYLSELKAYGHEGEPCPRCSDPIEKIVLGGRGTHYCARCQPPPRQQEKR
jgi:formamidopyrimidine-DNA glycosylase